MFKFKYSFLQNVLKKIKLKLFVVEEYVVENTRPKATRQHLATMKKIDCVRQGTPTSKRLNVLE